MKLPAQYAKFFNLPNVHGPAMGTPVRAASTLRNKRTASFKTSDSDTPRRSASARTHAESSAGGCQPSNGVLFLPGIVAADVLGVLTLGIPGRLKQPVKPRRVVSPVPEVPVTREAIHDGRARGGVAGGVYALLLGSHLVLLP